MFVFRYMDLPRGVTRPVIAVIVAGPSGKRIIDGLLDTGSDRTILPQRLAQAIGVQLPDAPDGSLIDPCMVNEQLVFARRTGL
jgi:predicted aspartyl protease